MSTLINEHVVATPGVCGGKPRIAGHRIRVIDIAVCHERQGLSPDEIISTYPGLTLAEVHSALAYFFDHHEEILADIADEREYAGAMREATPSLLRQKIGTASDG